MIKSRILTHVLAAALLGGLAVPVVQAEQPAATATPAPPPAPRSSKERLSFVSGVASTLNGYINTLNQKLAAANAASDTVLVNCLNEKIGFLQPLATSANEAAAAMSTAIANDNLDQQEAQETKARIAGDSAQTYYNEAMGCVNNKGLVPGQAQVVVTNRSAGGTNNANDFASSNNGATRNNDASGDGG